VEDQAARIDVDGRVEDHRRPERAAAEDDEAKRLKKELVALLQRASKTCESDATSRTKRRRYTLTIALLPADRDGGKA